MTAKPIIEFDHHSEDYAINWRKQAHAMHEAGHPLAWTEAHGGYWVVADYEAVKKIAADPAGFSSFNDPEGGPLAPKGILIPPSPMPMALNEQDPPCHGKRRMIEAPMFTPRHLPCSAERAQRYIDEAIDAIIAEGGGELVMDLALPVPAKTTINLIGVSEDEWKDYALPAHMFTQVPADHPDYPINELINIQGRLADLVRQRRIEPEEDMATRMAQASIDGEPIDVDVAAGMLLSLAVGGFDTATSSICHALIWLGDNRDIWPEVLESDKSLDNAVLELLRYFPPNSGIGRTVMEDVEICGQTLQKGDRLYLSWPGANNDPKKFPDPDTVQIDRANASEHVSFSAGPHRCLGAPLARMEIHRVLKSVLTRIPNYRILKDQVIRNKSIAMVNGFSSVPFVLD